MDFDIDMLEVAGAHVWVARGRSDGAGKERGLKNAQGWSKLGKYTDDEGKSTCGGKDELCPKSIK